MDVIWIVISIILIIIVSYLICVLLIIPKLSPPPMNLGVKDGRLVDCPKSPNCVSTQADPNDSVHYIPPIQIEVGVSEAHEKLKEVIKSMPRSKVITDKPNYIHAEFRSFLWRFIDDVEFFLDAEAKIIHFRSASRLGHGDMGMNRKRMEKIRSAFQDIQYYSIDL
ncbi:MAG: DUF1499 domain-containing protein [Candidatus Helarchaeota archaeon]